jgi:SAM-dependent methyltransferase
MSGESTCADRTYSNRGNTRLLELLPPGRTLLDCGCGAGDNARVLAAGGWVVTGITISPREAELASRHCAHTIIANLERGVPLRSTQYDVVLISHVLEHLVSPDRLLGSIKALLAPDGVLAVGLPNVANWRVRLALLRGRFEYTDTGIMDETHVKFYTLESGKRLLTRNGYEVTAALADGWLPIGRVRGLIPTPAVDQIDRWCTARFPGLLGFQNVFIAKPHGPGGRAQERLA